MNMRLIAVDYDGGPDAVETIESVVSHQIFPEQIQYTLAGETEPHFLTTTVIDGSVLWRESNGTCWNGVEFTEAK